MNNINFEIDKVYIKKMAKLIINNNKKWLKNIKNVDITPIEFLESYLYHDKSFDYITGLIYFLENVSTDSEIREESVNFGIKLQNYYLNFYKSYENYKLFSILKKIKIKNDKNNTKKLIKNILRSFENNGVHFKSDKKKKFIKLSKDYNKLKIKFSMNISNDNKIMEFSKKELDGISNNYLKNHKKEEKYIFDTSYPDKSIILKDCDVPKTREKMYCNFYNIASKNLNILKNIINIRTKISKMYGFKNTIEHYLSYNRLATEKKIDSLLNNLIPYFKNKANNEYKNLLIFSEKKDLFDYDMSYYSNKYKKNILDIDNNLIKNYFPSNYCINEILKIYSDLFGVYIKYIKEDSSKYWHLSVDLYEVIDIESNVILGYLYLDLYPRLGKYTHAATFDLQTTYIDNEGKRILPITAIVCNFTPPDKDMDYSLFQFYEIETFCHELGHGLHNILSNVKYQGLSGISMEDDFGEMPSQFFENWCYNQEFLKKISKHYETNEHLPLNIIKNIIKNRKFQNGLSYLTQILYIKYDMKIHKKKNITEKELYELWFKIQNELLNFKTTKNIYPMCRFDHLMSYAVGYYGYLWSLIYSHQAFSLFEKEGVFNKELGIKFRKEILEKGGTLKGTTMLKNFMGKNLDNDILKFF